MPGLKNTLLPPLAEAANQANVQDIEQTYQIDEVKKALLDITSDLLAVQQQPTLFGSLTSDPYTPSLETIHSRLQKGYLAPSPLQTHAHDEERAKEMLGKKTGKAPLMRPLEDLEDMYYAMLARIKDMHHTLGIRLDSGFNTPTEPLVENGLSIANFGNWLVEQWRILNEGALVKVLDDAVRRSRVKHLHQELLSQLHNGELTQSDADELLADLYDPEEYEGLQGMAWIGGWSSAMIGAWLMEKYRIVLKVEQEAVVKKERWMKKQARIERANARKAAADRIAAEQRQRLDEQQMQLRQEQEQLQLQMQPQAQYVDFAWQERTHRVHQYSQYLRDTASPFAVQAMSSGLLNGAQQSFYLRRIEEMGEEEVDTVMSNAYHY